MHRRAALLCAVALAALLAAVAAAQVVSDEERAQGFVPLFNGKDLSGWHGGGPSWFVENGCIVCSGKSKKKGHYLISDKQYGDFILRLEYKIAKGGNSGIFFRCVNENDIVQSGNEIQILDSYGKKKATVHDAGALYNAVAPSKNVARPYTEWNEVEITCKGTRLVVVMNGEKIIDCDLSDPQIKRKQPGGDNGKRGPRGYLALQNHGSRVEFRNLRIKVLD